MKYIFAILLAFVTVFPMFAQTQENQDEIIILNNKQYYKHIVQKGETLYAISKKYNIPVEQIKQANKGLDENLALHQVILIPFRKNPPLQDSTYVPKNKSDYLQVTVQKGQTLYSISKAYGVSINDIAAINPNIEDGLKEGQVLFIPIKKLKQESAVSTQQSVENYITHKVKRKETLYALSKKYKVSIEAIKEANGGLPAGLKQGQIIRIPQKTAVVKHDVSINKNFISLNDSLKVRLDTVFKQNVTDSALIVKKDVYHIGVILPFFASDNRSAIEDLNPNEQLLLKGRSHIAYDMLNGIKLALDSLQKQGFRYRLYLFDTKGKDSLQVAKILTNPEFEKLDLIFGPLYSENCKKIAQKANRLQIPVICPVNQSNKLLLGNQTLIKGVASEVIRVKALAQKVMRDFSTYHKIVSYGTNAQENLLSDIFIREVSLIKDTVVDSTMLLSIHVTQCNSACITNIISNIKRYTVNVIYVPFKDDYKITALLTALNNVLSEKESKTRIILLGSEKILKYDNIDPEYLSKVNFTYATSQKNDSVAFDKINCYFATQKVKYTTLYALDAFDFMYYAAAKMQQQGKYFFKIPDTTVWQGARNLIFLQKTGIESGYENIGIAIQSIQY